MNESSKVEELIGYSKVLYERKLIHATGGNTSVRDGEFVWISQTGAKLGELTENEIVKVDLQGNVLSGSRPSKEMDMHLAMYRAREENLVSFPNVTTGACITYIAVPLMITRATPANPNLHLNEKSILSLFGEAGYKTYWLSNQTVLGRYNTDNTTVSAHTGEASTIQFFNQSDLKQTPYDAILLEPLQNILDEQGGGNRFIVLHTMGSHWNYNYRYPDAFDIFRPSLRNTDSV